MLGYMCRWVGVDGPLMSVLLDAPIDFWLLLSVGPWVDMWWLGGLDM